MHTVRNRYVAQTKIHGRIARITLSNWGKKKEYEEHLLKPPNVCHKVLWTDESKTRLRYSHDMIFIWRLDDKDAYS